MKAENFETMKRLGITKDMVVNSLDLLDYKPFNKPFDSRPGSSPVKNYRYAYYDVALPTGSSPSSWYKYSEIL